MQVYSASYMFIYLMPIPQAISGYQDPDVVCKLCIITVKRFASDIKTVGADIPWLQSITKLPLIIKGIQCVEVRVDNFSSP